MRLSLWIVALAALLGTSFGTLSAQAAALDRETDTDGFDPAAESFRINEARRLNELSRQLELNYRMIWDHGFNPASPPIRQPIGQETIPLGPNKSLSRPIYSEDLPAEALHESGPELLPAPNTGAILPGGSVPKASGPPVANPAPSARRGGGPLPRTPAANAPGPRDARPADQVVPARPSPVRGPREF